MYRPNRQSTSSWPHCRGFSLVELMVAMVITLILLSGIGQIFLSSKKSFTIQDTLARQQENGRYALDTLAQEVRRAGYWGGNSDVTRIEGTVGRTDDAINRGTCGTGDTTWGRMVESRIYGIDDAKTGYNCIPDNGTANGHEQGDVLVVRHAGSSVIGGVTTPVFENNRIYLRSDLFFGRIFRGANEGLANNEIASPDRVVGFNADGGCDEGTPYTPDGSPPTGCLLNVNLSTIRVSELAAHAFYIGRSSQTCTNGDAVPSLFRINLDDNGQPEIEEIAYGIDQFQVRYGIDDDIDPSDPDTLCGDRSVDRYLNADEINLDLDLTDGNPPAAPHWGQVIAAKIWLLTRAECLETGYTNTNTYTMGDFVYDPNPDDGYRRQLYQTTVKLRNR